MSAVSATYFLAAPECMGLLWTPMNVPMSTYYPIAVVGGIVVAILFLSIFLKKTVLSKKASTLA